MVNVILFAISPRLCVCWRWPSNQRYAFTVSGRRSGDRFPEIDEVFDEVAKEPNRLIESEQKDEKTQRNTNCVKTRLRGSKSAAPRRMMTSLRLHGNWRTPEPKHLLAAVIVQGPGCGRSFSMIDGINGLDVARVKKFSSSLATRRVPQKPCDDLPLRRRSRLRNPCTGLATFSEWRALRGNEHLEFKGRNPYRWENNVFPAHSTNAPRHRKRSMENVAASGKDAGGADRGPWDRDDLVVRPARDADPSERCR